MKMIRKKTNIKKLQIGIIHLHNGVNQIKMKRNLINGINKIKRINGLIVDGLIVGGLIVDGLIADGQTDVGVKQENQQRLV